jgi:hypothetical protein
MASVVLFLPIAENMKKLITLALIAASACAQSVSCLLSGTVHDPTGAVVPAARVRLTAAGTGFVRTTTTNGDGFFSFPDLTASTFAITVSATGFKTYGQPSIEIRSGEQRSLGIIAMEVGAASESITVTAEASTVMTASGERSGVVTDRDLANLAIKSRDIMDAVALLPGVVDLNDSREAPSTTSGNNVFILGGRDNQKNMTIDGVTNLDVGDSRAVVSMPSIDSVAELKVLMANYSAESGRNTGGSITIITKGGARQFHASAGWYHRHEQFAANDYFNNRNGVGRPRYRYNIVSYTVSGPIFIPGKFNSDRSKLFFFYSQEFQEQLVSAASRTVTVPTALERNGDYSRTLDTNGKLIPVYDARNNQTVFPGNVIPASRIDPIGRKILDLFPLPNFTDPAPSRVNQWNYIYNPSYAYPRRSQTFRIDYSPRANLQMYARFNHNSDTQQSPYLAGLGFDRSTFRVESPSWSATFHATATLSPTMFNEFVFGLPNASGPKWLVDNPEALSRKATGIDLPQWYPGNNPANIIPAMTFSSVANPIGASLSNDYPGFTNSVSPTFADNLSKIAGTHTVKAGIYIERSRKNRAPGTATRGALNFGRDRTNPLDTNYAWTNALTGVFLNYSEATARPGGRLRFTNAEWYVQDDWRVRPRLFLNYGLRFYHDPAQYDQLDGLSMFQPGSFAASKAPTLLRPALDARNQKVAIDPRTGVVYPSTLVGAFVPNSGDPANGMVRGGSNGVPSSLTTFPAISLAPRVGFSWDPFGKGRTVLRGGAGIYFNRSLNSPWTYMLSNPPNVYTPTVYYGDFASLSQVAGTAVLAPSTVRTFLTQPEQKPETTYNFSLGVQQRLKPRLILDVSYVGSLARRLWWIRNINAVPVGAQFLDLHPENRDPSSPAYALAANFLRPYQAYGDINAYEMGGSSAYHAFQANSRYAIGRGSITAAYTFSKVTGVASNWDSAVSPFFSPIERHYGVLNYDRTHVLTFSYNYALPKPGSHFHQPWLGIVTDHWEVSGVTRILSGAPFTPGLTTVDGANFTGTPSEGARPDVVNPTADPINRFGRPAARTFGNTGQNVLRGPGVNNWDISIYRRIPLRRDGAKYLQLRFESYNTLNHTQFSAVSTAAKFDAQGNQVDPLFLTPTSARAPRRVQLALRLAW